MYDCLWEYIMTYVTRLFSSRCILEVNYYRLILVSYEKNFIDGFIHFKDYSLQLNKFIDIDYLYTQSVKILIENPFKL